MRPFKFFFLFSIAVMIFFALAKVVLVALFFAAVMSLIFFGLKTLGNFINKLSWDNGNRRNYSEQYLRGRDFDFQNSYSNFDFNNPRATWEKEQIIHIR